jgi:WD40 repeat protein
MFISLNRTFETASTLKDDIRELIPEFYVLPEMFLNINNLNLSQDKLDSEGNKIVINEVELPPWSNNRNANFVVEMRKNLEKKDIKINKWIDLIFGYLQKGEKAEENHNIFMLNTYEGMVNIENIKDEDEKNALMRLVEVGVTPLQIFSSESKPRNDISQIMAKVSYSNSKELFLWECKDLGCLKISMYKYHKIIQKLINDYKQYKDSDNLILPRIIKIKAVSKNEIRIFTNCNFWYNIKITKNENKYIIEESALCELNNISSTFAPSYQISNIQTPIVVFGNNKFIIRGGFWDGRLEINVLNPDAKEEKDNINFCIHNQEGPVITMEISKNEDLLICGTIYGSIVAYQIEYINNNSNIKLNLIKKLYDHDSSINSISINNHLNIFATCANEDNIYLYLLPTFKVFRVIKISEKNNGNNDEENELLVPNNLFLSYSPLPSLSIFINSKRTFKSYTINGEFIGETKETNNTNSIKCSIIFNDLTFCDYVIYGTDDGMVKIRSFPDMNLISFYSPLDCYEITCLELSLDKKYCYIWSKGGDIFEIKDIAIKDPNEVEQKKFKF